MVKTQLCKLRDTSDTLIGRACDMFHLQLAFVSYMYDIVVGTQFHKFYGRPSARVQYLHVPHEIYIHRSVTPLGTATVNRMILTSCL